MIARSRIHSFSPFSDWIEVLTSINEGNYCVKGMWELQVNTSKTHAATAKNFKEAICHKSAQLYLKCALSGISRLKKKNETNQKIANLLYKHFGFGDGLGFAKGSSTLTEMVTYQHSPWKVQYLWCSTWYTWLSKRNKMLFTKYAGLTHCISPSLHSFKLRSDTDSSLPVCVCVSAGGDGHQPHGVVSSQQPGQLLQPAPR